MISIIIPTFNEEKCIGELVSFLRKSDYGSQIEIIVADGQSTDQTVLEAERAGARVFVSLKKGRAAQMNFGAMQASSPILYFLHADTFPPQSFVSDLLDKINSGYHAGCYRLKFDYNQWFLNLNCWFTRFDVNAFRFGDQSLFVNKEIFLKSGGFREDLIVMEDQEIISRLKRMGKFVVLDKAVTTSARKYLQNGIYKMQAIFFLIYFMYKLGYSQEMLLKTYKRQIKQDKL